MQNALISANIIVLWCNHLFTIKLFLNKYYRESVLNLT